MPEYDGTPARAPLRILEPANGLAPSDPARMAAAIIASVDQDSAPLRMILGSQALQDTLKVLNERVAASSRRRVLPPLRTSRWASDGRSKAEDRPSGHSRTLAQAKVWRNRGG
jgi:hypothetical protein